MRSFNDQITAFSHCDMKYNKYNAIIRTMSRKKSKTNFQEEENESETDRVRFDDWLYAGSIETSSKTVDFAIFSRCHISLLNLVLVYFRKPDKSNLLITAEIEISIYSTTSCYILKYGVAANRSSLFILLLFGVFFLSLFLVYLLYSMSLPYNNSLQAI